MITYNFMADKPVDFNKSTAKKYVDTRNGIECYNPSFSDLSAYINYIDLLNLNRDKWLNYGYLDLGMMPLAMAPSFIQKFIREGIKLIADNLNLTTYSMPPVSMFYKKCMIAEDDIWVFKEDVAKIMGIKETQVNLVEFLRWCENNGFNKA